MVRNFLNKLLGFFTSIWFILPVCVALLLLGAWAAVFGHSHGYDLVLEWVIKIVVIVAVPVAVILLVVAFVINPIVQRNKKMKSGADQDSA